MYMEEVAECYPETQHPQEPPSLQRGMKAMVCPTSWEQEYEAFPQPGVETHSRTSLHIRIPGYQMAGGQLGCDD